MIIKFHYWEKTPDLDPDYDRPIFDYVTGKNACECMQKINALKYNHDRAKYTPIEIYDVED